MGKWAVSESVWPDKTYEDHCSGWLWVTTPEVYQSDISGDIDLVE